MEGSQSAVFAIIKVIWTIMFYTWPFVVGIILYFTWKNFHKANTVESQEKHELLSIKIPKNNDKGPVASEMMFAALHGILQPKKARKRHSVVQEHLSFEIVANPNSIEFFVWTPHNLKDFVEGQVYAQYPTAEIEKVTDYTKELDDEDHQNDAIAGTELHLTRDGFYPIKTFQSFDVDPLAGITGMLSKLDSNGEKVWIQILALPVDDSWRNKGLKFIDSVKNGTNTSSFTVGNIDIPGYIVEDIADGASAFFHGMFTWLTGAKYSATEKKPGEKKRGEKETKTRVSHHEEVSLSAIEEKANKLGFKVKVRIMYISKTTDQARERIQAVYGAFKQFNTTNLNGFERGDIYTGENFINAYRKRLMTEPNYVLNIEELASLYHLPHVSVETPNIVWTSSKKGEPPANLHYMEGDGEERANLTPLGMTTFRGVLKPFGITRDDRRRHAYIIGKSGTGKSRLLENLAIDDIQSGEGVAIVDPHGEMIERMLKYIPKERIKDVVYFNPADRDFPIAFNPLESDPEFREEVVNGFVSVMKKLFGYSWGPRLEYVLKHTVAALTEVEGSTMLGIVRLLTDKNYRKKIVNEVSDPVVQMFWLKEFATYNDKMATETIAPILNKVGQFTASPVIRNIVGQPKGNIDFAKIMNEQKILLVDLSTGKIGEANSQLLGSMVITKLQLAAMSRAYIPEDQRKDFFLYVDEFQNFATESFAVILSEARKYRLSLTVANQYVAQMDETVRDAVFGNVGTIISFRVGATDASFLEKEFLPVFEQNDLINLDNRHIYVSMLINGVSSVPFSAMSLDSPAIKEDLSSLIVNASRERYGTTRKSIEEDIRSWYNVDSVIAGVNANEGDQPFINKRPNRPFEQNRREQKPDREEREDRGDREVREVREEKNKEIKNSDPLKESKKGETLGDYLTKNKQLKDIKENKPTTLEPVKDDNREKEKSLHQPTLEKREEKPATPRTASAKVDKDVLKNIIKDTMRPRSKEKDLPDRVVSEKKEPIVDIDNDKKGKDHPVGEKELRDNSPITKSREHQGIKITAPKHEEVDFYGKKVREITPAEFSKMKTIHPNEKITVKNTQEIKPGETVKF